MSHFNIDPKKLNLVYQREIKIDLCHLNPTIICAKIIKILSCAPSVVYRTARTALRLRLPNQLRDCSLTRSQSLAGLQKQLA